MRLSACGRLPLRPIDATWYRAIAGQHWSAALRSDHTTRVASRFSPGASAETPFEVIYLGESHLVALYEGGALFGPPDRAVSDPHKSHILPFAVRVRLQAVADLSDSARRDQLAASAQELTGNWDTYPPGEAPTQRLGAALFATKRVEGFIAISAKMPRCRTLIVFPQKLRKGSELVFEDPITGKAHRVGP